MILGILKERKEPPDKRVVFSPKQLENLKIKYPDLKIQIESSDIRIFPDSAYLEKGFKVTSDLSECDILLGVKEVPIKNLIPNKTYFFFSHTIKKQEHNRDLLKAVLKKNIRLIDYETIVDHNNKRLIGFGKYAGIVGVYNGFRALGLRNDSFYLEKVENLSDYEAVLKELKKLRLPADYKILLTGNGRVADGVREVLANLNLKEVDKSGFLNKSFSEPVYCQIHVLDYNKRKDKQIKDKYDFYQNPEDYISDFRKFTSVTNYFIAGHFYGQNSPILISQKDVQRDDFKIDLIADISCDIGPIAPTLRASSIADPFYGYDPKSGKEVKFDAPGAITVMAVDNLPCELAKDASEGFGEMFMNHIIPALVSVDAQKILERATITEKGQLTPRFSYLQDFVDD